jgi:spectinomycin phosphotransferase
MEQELIAQLEKTYNMHVEKLVPGPRQVIAQTYIIDDSSGKQYFCKIINHPLLIPGIIQTLPVVEQMYKNGINKICYPIHGDNGLYFYTGQSLVVLFNYIPITQGINYNPYILGSMIANVHAITPKITVAAPLENFEFPNCEFFMESFESTLQSSSTDIVVQQLKTLLQEHEAEVHKYMDEFATIAARCKANTKSLVLTHGDLGNNILAKTPDDLYIIDWDEMRLAPAERDVFMNDENAEFMAGYKSVRPDFIVDLELRRFCILQRYFERMSIYLAQILDNSTPEEYRLDRLKKFAKGHLAGDCLAKLEDVC